MGVVPHISYPYPTRAPTLEPSRYLLNAFKQCDADMSGKLSKAQVEYCFGPKWLNLNVSSDDLDDFVEVYYIRVFRCFWRHL